MNFTSRVILSPLLPVLEPELGLGHGETGSLFLILQFGYCTGLLLSVFVACRLSHRGTILLSTVAAGLILLALSRSTSLTGLRVGLWLLGTSAGLYLPAGISLPDPTGYSGALMNRSPDGTVFLSLGDQAGKPGALLNVSADGSSGLTLYDRNGKTIFSAP